MTALVSQKFVSQEKPPRQTGFKALIIVSLLLASFGLIFLAVRPDLDLKSSAAFFEPRDGFIGQLPLARNFRLFAEILPFIIYFCAILAYLGGALWIGLRRFSHPLRSLIFLTATLALGPGLIVNTGFKAHFHRPRPVHVQEFGGAAAFQPFYQQQGDCAKNCSFPSGEAAAAFWIVAPAILTAPPLRTALVGAAMLFGLVTGLFRMAAGAHFLSDVLFSGWIMGVIIAGLWFVTMWRWPRRDEKKAKTGLHQGGASL